MLLLFGMKSQWPYSHIFEYILPMFVDWVLYSELVAPPPCCTSQNLKQTQKCVPCRRCFCVLTNRETDAIECSGCPSEANNSYY